MAKASLYVLKNAEATFTIAGSGTETDPVTGNVRPAAATVSYSLYLREANRAGETARPGTNNYTALWDGYVVNPSSLDSRIRPGTPGTLKVGDAPARSCVVRDAKYAYGSIGIPGSVLSKVLGDSILIEQTW